MNARIRSSLASLAFLGIFVLHLRIAAHGQTWTETLFVVVPLLAAAACHSPWLAPLVATRALAWLHVVIGSLAALPGGHAEPVVGSVLGAVALTALGREAHESRAAEAGFEPVAYRGAFLAASTATVALAMLVGFLGLIELLDPWGRAEAVVSLVIASGLVAAAMLVLRMRALGVVLGVGVAALALVGAAFEAESGREIDGPITAVLWTCAAIPALALAAPVVWSRLRPAHPDAAATRPRIAWTSALALGIALVAAASAVARSLG